MEQRLSLFYGPLMRSYKLKNDFFSPQTLAVQCERLLQSIHGRKAHAPSLIIPLYVMLCQQRSNACSSTDTTNVRGSFEVSLSTIYNDPSLCALQGSQYGFRVLCRQRRGHIM